MISICRITSIVAKLAFYLPLYISLAFATNRSQSAWPYVSATVVVYHRMPFALHRSRIFTFREDRWKLLHT